MRRKKLLAVLILLITSVVSPTFSEDYRFTLTCVVPTDDCRIDAVVLSHQKFDPFLFQGKVMDEEHPQWRKYSRVIERYPDVLSCLIRSEQSSPNPNLLLIDWDRVGTGSGAEVCIFRIARSLKDLEQLRAWLDIHEFRVQGPISVYSDGYVPRFSTEKVAFLMASWDLPSYREKNPSLLAKLGIELIYGYQLSVSLSERGQVVGVHVGTPTTFN